MMFQVEGKMKLGNENRKFCKKVEAKSEKDSLNTVLSQLGSMNGVKRSAIKIDKVSKIEG